jgi:hypothetical protein
MQAGAVVLFPLFRGPNLPAQASELSEFLLDCLQPFMPLAVSDMSIHFIPLLTAILRIQLLNLSNLRTETPDPLP